MNLTITLTTKAGYIRTLDVDTVFVGIVGMLSRDNDVRDWAAFGSAALSENDR